MIIIFWPHPKVLPEETVEGDRSKGLFRRQESPADRSHYNLGSRVPISSGLSNVSQTAWVAFCPESKVKVQSVISRLVHQTPLRGRGEGMSEGMSNAKKVRQQDDVGLKLDIKVVSFHSTLNLDLQGCVTHTSVRYRNRAEFLFQ